MIDLDVFGQGWRGFALLWLAIYAGLLAIYFVCGSVLERLNAAHPELRIQPVVRSSRDAADRRQSMLSLTTIALYVAGGLWLPHIGWSLFAPAALSVWSVIGFFVLGLVVYDSWFYWGHRTMHSKALFRFHALHHRSLTPTAWSNNSDSLVGAFFEQSYFLFIPLLVPFPVEVLIAHKIWDQITGAIGHAGFEYAASPIARWPLPMVATTYHDQHHSAFRCNYGNTFTWWDRLMGTLHPRYDETVARLEAVAGGKRKRAGEAVAVADLPETKI